MASNNQLTHIGSFDLKNGGRGRGDNESDEKMFQIEQSPLFTKHSMRYIDSEL